MTQGPDAGSELSGVLSLGKVGKNGSFAGTLADPVNGTIAVTGRVVGDRIKLAFDDGPGGQFGGVGPFTAQAVGKGRVRLTSFGSLQTGNPADSGDWAVATTALTSYTAATTADLIADINLANAAGVASTITLTAPTTTFYNVTAANNATYGNTAFPVITGNVTIVGGGDTILAVTLSNVRANNAYRFFSVAASGSLRLQNLTLQGAYAHGAGVAAQGGAVYSLGNLTLTGVTVLNNTAAG